MLDLLTGFLDAGMGIYDTINDNMQADKNLELQRDQFNTQEDWNKKTWARDEERYQTTMSREDNATQRKAADLKAAGLSPVLAAGSAASASSFGTPNPKTAPAPQRAQTSIQPFKAQEIAAAAQNMMRQDQNIATSKTQRALLETQNEREKWNLNYYKDKGLPTDAPPVIKTGASLIGAAGTIWDKVKDNLKLTEAEKKVINDKINGISNRKTIDIPQKSATKESDLTPAQRKYLGR